MSSSEVEMQRVSLLGVDPRSRSLKFLNTKNNIADLYLKKKLIAIKRESSCNLAALEQSKIDTRDFLTNIQKLEQDTEAFKQIMGRTDNEDDYPSPRRYTYKRRDKQARKIRLAQTAPANLQKNSGDMNSSCRLQQTKSGPETQAERDHMIEMDRQKSMFIRLPGHGKQNSQNKENKLHSQHEPAQYSEPVAKLKRTESIDEVTLSGDKKKKKLPEPSAKSMLDVMIGLNAFSFVPPRRLSSRADSFDAMQSESRDSMSRESMYGSQENAANKFMLHWKNKIANRKTSIFMKLEAKQEEEHRLHESMYNVIEEDTESEAMSQKRKSKKWSVRPSVRPVSNLPAITDEGEKMEVFLAWVNEEREKKKKLDNEYVNQADRTAVRRNSFKKWLENRKEKMKENERQDLDNSKKRLTKNKNNPHVQIIRDESVSPPDIGCLMKTMLTIKTRFRDPLESRVKRFNDQLDELKRKDAEAEERARQERERRKMRPPWEDYGDEDEYYYY